MKMIHTADLHIGKRLYGYDLLQDQELLLRQLLSICEAERPDAILIAGDIYDKSIPSSEAVRLFDDFITALSDMGICILAIGGNHDTGKRLDFGSRIMSARGVHIAGSFQDRLMRVELHDAYGAVQFWLMPYLNAAELRYCFNQERTKVPSLFGQINFVQRNVLLSHQYYRQTCYMTAEEIASAEMTSGMECLDAAPLRRFDYAALGHIHVPGTVGCRTAVYAGSMLQYAFSDKPQKKSVALVQLRAKGDVSIERIPLQPHRQMRRVSGPIEGLLSGACRDGRNDDYVHIQLTDAHPPVEALAMLRNVYPNIMQLEYCAMRQRTEAKMRVYANPYARVRNKEGVSVDPLRLFQDFYAEQTGAALDAEQLALMREVIQTARGLV